MKGSISNGQLYAGNLQGLAGTITTNSSGDGSVSLSFRHKMKKVPACAGVSINTLDTTGTLTVTSITQTGAKFTIDGSSVTSGSVKVSGIFFDDTYN